jgi:hypothetical protein
MRILLELLLIGALCRYIYKRRQERKLRQQDEGITIDQQ